MRSENGNTKIKVIVIVLIIFFVIYGIYVYKKGSNKKRDFLDEENKVVYREDFSDQLDTRHEIGENSNLITNTNKDIENLVNKNEIERRINSMNMIITKKQKMK